LKNKLTEIYFTKHMRVKKVIVSQCLAMELLIFFFLKMVGKDLNNVTYNLFN